MSSLRTKYRVDNLRYTENMFFLQSAPHDLYRNRSAMEPVWVVCVLKFSMYSTGSDEMETYSETQ